MMANGAIPGFSESEAEVLRRAQREGRLTDAQKQEVVRRANQAGETGDARRAVDQFRDRPSLRAHDPRPEDISEATGGIINRGAFEAAGGMAGGAAGTPLGLPGMLGGGALGAGMGSLTFDTVDSFLRFTGTLQPRQDGPLSPTEAAQQGASGALRAAREDALFGGGFASAGAAITAAKPILGRILGARSSGVDNILLQARNAGLTRGGEEQLGAIDAVGGTRGRIMRGGGFVLGIFPFIGTPFRRAAQQKGEAVTEAVNRSLNTLAPNASMSDDLGIDMVRAARNTQEEFRTTAARLYDNFRKTARSASKREIVPTKPMRDAAAEIVEEADRQTIRLSDGEVIEGAAADQINDLLSRVSRMPEHITVDQLQGQADRLKDIIDTGRAQGFDVSRFVRFKEAMEEATASLNLSGLPESEARAITEAKEAADSFYSKGIALFQTPTGQRFGRVDRNIFRPGPNRPGTMNEDEFANSAVNLKSAQAVRDLGNLVGKENMGRVARTHVERSWDNAILFDTEGQIKGVSWEDFRRNLGLVEPRGIGQAGKSEGTRELLRQGGIDPQQVEDLISVASRISVPRDVNQFIARRAALGGLGSAAAGAGMGAMVKDSLIASTAVAVLLRRSGEIISSPEQLKRMRRAVDPDLSVSAKRANLGRLLENFGQAQTEATEEPSLEQPLGP